jgi:hypothetical protein
MTGKRWLRVPEAALYMRLAEDTLNKFRCYGGGPQYTKRGRCILYRDDWCDQWLENGVRRSTSEYVPAEDGGARSLNSGNDSSEEPKGPPPGRA